MNVTGGFNTGFSFFYADQNGFTGSVGVFDGLDGTGTQLASLSLPPTPNPYTVWVPVGVSFAGTAMSVVFGGAADFIAFDDITLGTDNPTLTPEPSTFAIAGLGCLGFVGYALRRRRNATAA